MNVAAARRPQQWKTQQPGNMAAEWHLNSPVQQESA